MRSEGRKCFYKKAFGSKDLCPFTLELGPLTPAGAR